MSKSVFDGLLTVEKRFRNSCNQSKLLFVVAQLTYIQFSSTEAIFEENIQHMFFDECFSKQNWAMVLYHMISISPDSRSLTKNSEGYRLLKVIHLAFWLLKLLSMDFSSTIYRSMDFLSRKPVSLQRICLITVNLAFPSLKWFWFLFHHWRRQFPWILLRWNTISRTFRQFNSIWLISNRFNWFPWIFFQSKRDLRNFFQCNRFPRKSYPQSFNFFHFFPINTFCSQGLPISGKSFLVLTEFKRNFLCFLVDGAVFRSFFMDEMLFTRFSNNEVQFLGFPTNEVTFQ